MRRGVLSDYIKSLKPLNGSSLKRVALSWVALSRVALSRAALKSPVVGLGLLLLLSAPLAAQTSQPAGATVLFHRAANQYIAGQQQEALQTVEHGLRQYPSDAKLQALAEKLKQQQQQNQQQDQQQNQQSQQQQQDAEGQDSEQNQNQQGAENQQPNQQQEQQQQQENEQQQLREAQEGDEREVQPLDPRGEAEKRLQEMNISPEKARMLLEAMRSNEIQYLQQKKRQATRRPKSNKPDW
jgi:hypothetical protein